MKNEQNEIAKALILKMSSVLQYWERTETEAGTNLVLDNTAEAITFREAKILLLEAQRAFKTIPSPF